MDLISIVILNYNGGQLLKTCIGSVLRQSYERTELIVVDNASTDNSVEFLKEAYPDIKLVENSDNLGFAEANNIGVSYASGEYVVLLNNDVIVMDDWLEKLYNCIKTNNAVLADSKVINSGQPAPEKNGTLNLLGRNIPEIFHDPEVTFYASGCSMIFKRESIPVPFDKIYFAYQEDVYLGWKTRLEGGRICHCPDSVLEHIGSHTAKKIKTCYLTFLQERNRLLNLLIFYELNNLIKIIPLIIVESLFVLVNRKKSFSGFVKAVLWLFLHPALIKEKRCSIQKNRVRSDKEIIAMMTCKLVYGDTAMKRLINFKSKVYCKLFGIMTYEFIQQ